MKILFFIVIILYCIIYCHAPLPNRSERNVSGVSSSTIASTLRQINRRITGIRRTIQHDPDEDTIRRSRHEAMTLFTNFERLQSIVYPTTYRRTIQSIVQLQEQIEGIMSRIQQSNTNTSTTTANNTISNDFGEAAIPDFNTDPASAISSVEPPADDVVSSSSQSSVTSCSTRFRIDQNKLEQLLSLGFTVRRVARDGLLGRVLHHNTIHNFIIRNGLTTIRNRYCQYSDNELRQTIGRIHSQFPNSGIREVVSHLRNQQPPLIVQRNRCARLLAEVDPVGTALRWAQAIQRRQYCVPSPNSLWHIDSNHALIRYVVLNVCVYNMIIFYVALWS